MISGPTNPTGPVGVVRVRIPKGISGLRTSNTVRKSENPISGLSGLKADSVIHIRLNPSEAEQFSPLLTKWRAEGNAGLFACVGETFDPQTGEVIIELSAIVVPRAVARKASSLLMKGATP